MVGRAGMAGRHAQGRHMAEEVGRWYKAGTGGGGGGGGTGRWQGRWVGQGVTGR